jgi:Ras GTPase-activating-like protein IQGAP2/3
MQATARGLLARRKMQDRLAALHRVEDNIVSLQAHARGVLVRRRVRNQLAKLDDAADVVLRIQAAARCFLARKRLLNLIRGLRRATPAVVSFQTLARAKLQKRHHETLNKALAEVKVVTAVGGLQALARAALVRKRHQEQNKRLEFFQPDVVGLQSTARGFLVRRNYFAWRDHLRASQNEATFLQALMRGTLERRMFQAKMRYYRENLDKVVKIQALFRAKDTREQYRQLTLGRNVTVGTIKNFVHLLDDSEADFEDEIELERLRKRVVQNIREVQRLETDVSELDTKIGLVVDNYKTFDDVIKAKRRHGQDTIAMRTIRASALAAHGDPFAGPSTLDQATKRKLELYQQLFYLLQTRGQYLSRLFHRLVKTNSPEMDKKLTEHVVLLLFGFGHDRREEYLLLKLLQVGFICITYERN